MSVADLPKVELHIHHEGAAPPEFIRRLGQEKSVNLSGVFRGDGSYAFNDFVHFLEVYEAATSVLKTPEDYGRLTTAMLGPMRSSRAAPVACRLPWCPTFSTSTGSRRPPAASSSSASPLRSPVSSTAALP